MVLNTLSADTERERKKEDTKCSQFIVPQHMMMVIHSVLVVIVHHIGSD